MADLNIKCPGCGQEMVCDDAYAGQQVQCPSCQINVTVPAKTDAGAERKPLVPKPPAGAGPKLSIGTKDTHGKGPAAQASHPANLRRTFTPPKKKLPIKDFAIYAALILILGGGGYFGYGFWQKRKAEQEAAAAPAKPAAAPAANPEMPAPNPDAPAEAVPAAGIPGAGEAPKPKPEKALPVVAPSYTMDAAFAKIAQSQVNGTISGGAFVAETIRWEQTPASQVLRFIQGAPTAIDRELVIYLKLKLADITNGHSINVSSDTRGSGLPQVVKRWRTSPTSRYAPSTKSFGYGYVMKLELGKASNGTVPGKLYVALPDKEETVVAGVFKLALPTFDPNQMPLTVPGMEAPMAAPAAPGMAPAERAAFERRYGTAK